MAVYITVILFTSICSMLIYNAERSEAPAVDVKTGRVRHKKDALIPFLLITVFLICISGLRYYVGTDFGAYYHYQKYVNTLKDSIFSLNEPGYPLIAYITDIICPDGAVAIFLASLITIGLSLKTIYKYSDTLWFCLLLFLFFGGWDGGFNGVRQYLAASVLFCGYPYLKKGNFWKYLLFVFLAFLCHKSALVMIVPFFLLRRKVNAKNIILLIVITIAATYSYDWVFDVANIVMDKTYTLENEYTAHAVNIIRVIVACAPIALFVPAWLGKTDEEHDFYLNIIIFAAVLRIITMKSALLYRIGIYTSLFEVMALPKLLSVYNKRDRTIITIAMVVLYGAYWLYEIINGDTTFRFIWQR